MTDENFKQRKNEPVELRWHELLTGEQLLQLAIRDPLTGLLNRRAFDEELHWIWKQGKDKPFPVGLLVVDIDEAARILPESEADAVLLHVTIED